MREIRDAAEHARITGVLEALGDIAFATAKARNVPGNTKGITTYYRGALVRRRRP